ncbi:RodZ domain-containing protein [Psychromonas antarctica]|uniref:RodZ domain-containing protein n=1 Tax=Psychromonas antarctica TaxID=67573 RepID=UPI001EE8A2BF|nr:RodZ domain-containing protein [Psychromonas antarctica]MCG6200912.1 DUF4115 domain-containing protein [Psychromonas antarctica]
MNTINNEEPTIVAPLGKTLQDARLIASLSVEAVAEQLNLGVGTIRDIEDNLDEVIENQKYPTIYLRGYLVNYAKLVKLGKLQQFIEYQKLTQKQKKPTHLRSPMIIPPVKKRSKTWLFLLLVIAAVSVFFMLEQQSVLLETGNENAPIEETKIAVEDNTSDSPVVISETDLFDLEADDITPSTVLIEEDEAVLDESADTEMLVTQESSEQVTSEAAEQFVAVENEANENAAVELDVAITEALQMTFSADCWTEIVDATGKRLAFDLYKKGAQLTVNGVPPFHLKLGKPSAVEILYQNKIVERDFGPDQITRFSIPQ